MKYVLFLIAILFSNQAVALDCSKQPTCEELNYSKDDDPQCAEDGYILCPFDSQYKKCVNFNCESLGFTKSDKSEWCADIAHCKTDENFTLCQTPCIAWDQESLKTLTASKKCKVITLKNDINVDSKTTINVAEGTTIDGGGHTLSISKTTGDVIQLQDTSSLRNISVIRKYNDTADTILIHSFDAVLENVTLIDENENSDSKNYKKLIQGTINIRGKCRLEVVSGGNYSIMSSGPFNFEDAIVDVIGALGASNTFVNPSGSVAKNSVINVTEEGYLFNGDNQSFTLINSTFKGKANELFWGAHFTITLEEGSHFEAELQYDVSKTTFVLNGTSEKPVSLVLNAKTYQEISIDVQNLATTVTYRGVTYRPKKIALTSSISSIPTSSDWEVVH